MEDLKPTLKKVLDVNIQAWRNQYNRNRRFMDTEEGYRHFPNKIIMHPATWEKLVNEFVGALQDKAEMSVVVPDENQPSLNAYCGVPVDVRDNMREGEFIVQ